MNMILDSESNDTQNGYVKTYQKNLDKCTKTMNGKVWMLLYRYNDIDEHSEKIITCCIRKIESKFQSYIAKI